MRWKRWVLSLSGALLACATTGTSTGPNEPPVSLAGDWHGALEAGPRKIGLDARFTEDSGTIDVREQGLRDQPLHFVERRGAKVVLRVLLPDGQPAFLDGTVEGSTLVGAFRQGGASAPFRLERGVRPPVARALGGEGFEEEDVRFNQGALTLAGTLTRPKGVSRPPVAVLISGSGPQDRDANIFGFRLFEQLAHGLARGGIATLRFDDRGVGQSTGDFLAATTADFATDVEAAVRFLRARPDVDTRRLGLIGHSEGGLVAPMVAAREPDVRFIVLLAAPGQPLAELLLAQVERVSKAEGKAADDTARALRVLPHALQLLRVGKDLSSMEEELATLCPAPCAAREAFVKAERWRMETRWFRAFAAYDPAPTLAKVRCAVLALGGSLDVQVPSDLNLPVLRRTLMGNPAAEVQEVPGMNHVLQAATTGAVSEYATLPKTVQPSVVPKLVSWIHAVQR